MNARFPLSRRALPLLAASVLALTACDTNEQSGAPPGGGMPPPAVTLETVTLKPVQIFGDFSGRVRGAREVEVRAQVAGILEERLFVEGRAIEAGTPMFRIERAPYQIALRRAEAELANARASLNQAEREWRRLSGLYEQNAVSERERDHAVSQRELAQAQVALAEASVAQARLNLEYTEVRAPLDGTTGLESVPEGSLIERGTLLATITRLDPVHVLFALPHNDRAAQELLRRISREGSNAQPIPAQLVFADGSLYEREGEIDFTDTSIDPSTGTVSARAIFPNPDRLVAPGLFVRVRLPLQRHDQAARIPPVAVAQSPGGPVVFVVDADHTAHARPVRLGPVADGQQVIVEGLRDGDRIVVNGQVAVRDGMTVVPRNGNDRDGGNGEAR